MARWMDENFQKNYIGDEKVSDALIELGKSYLAIKKIKDLPDFTKKAFDLFKTSNSKEKKILGFFEPQFFVIENSDQEKIDEWFEKYTNRCIGKEDKNLERLPPEFKHIVDSVYSSINNFDEKEIFDDESDLISEKEAKKQKKNYVTSEDDETPGASDDTSATTGKETTSATSDDTSAITGNDNK